MSLKTGAWGLSEFAPASLNIVRPAEFALTRPFFDASLLARAIELAESRL
jgi:hypothetical protein